MEKQSIPKPVLFAGFKRHDLVEELQLDTKFSTNSPASAWTISKLQVATQLSGHFCTLIRLEEVGFDAILKNLSEIIRKLGIEAVYFEEPVQAALLTPDHLQMDLKLFLNPSLDSVIVQVESYNGSEPKSQLYRRCFFESARGNFSSIESMLIGEMDLVRFFKAGQYVDGPVTTSQAFTASMEALVVLLRTSNQEKAVAALRALLVMLTPKTVGISTAVMAAIALLVDSKPANTGTDGTPFFGLLGCFLLLLQDSTTDTNAERLAVEDAERKFTTSHRIKIMALQAICLALDVIVSIDDVETDSSNGAYFDQTRYASTVIATFLKNAEKQFGVNVITICMKQIVEASKSPVAASYAVRSFLLIGKACRTQFPTELRLHGSVDEAHEVGMSRSAMLEQECARFKSWIANGNEW